MMSQAAPVPDPVQANTHVPLTRVLQITETRPKEGDMGSISRGAAFVSVYNDGDISEYLFTKPAFASGFLPLEPEVEAKTTQPQPPTHTRPITIKSTRRPTETFNTGTTPTEPAPVAEPTELPAHVKHVETPHRKVEERRPSFIEVTTPNVHGHAHDHDHDHDRDHEHKVEERRPSFIEVTTPHVHGHAHDHEHKDAHGGHHEHRRHSSSSQRAMGWWPEDEKKAQHEWVEADEEEDVIEDVIEDGYYASYD